MPKRRSGLQLFCPWAKQRYRSFEFSVPGFPLARFALQGAVGVDAFAGGQKHRLTAGRGGVSFFLHCLTATEEDQADRAISKAQLHALLRFHMPPIDVVVYHGS